MTDGYGNGNGNVHAAAGETVEVGCAEQRR